MFHIFQFPAAGIKSKLAGLFLEQPNNGLFFVDTTFPTKERSPFLFSSSSLATTRPPFPSSFNECCSFFQEQQGLREDHQGQE